MHMVDSNRKVHTSLVMSKTKVSPIKHLSIPCLELCGAQVLTQLLRDAKDAFQLPMKYIFAWTDGNIVLSWLIVTQGSLKPLQGTECPSLLIRYLQIDGITFVEPKTRLTVVYFLLSSWNRVYGGMDPLVIGPHNLISLQIVFLKKNMRFHLLPPFKSNNPSFRLTSIQTSPAFNRSLLGSFVSFTTAMFRFTDQFSPTITPP